MAAHQIPCGDQDSPDQSAGSWADGIEICALPRPCDRKSRVEPRTLRRNGPVAVQSCCAPLRGQEFAWKFEAGSFARQIRYLSNRVRQEPNLVRREPKLERSARMPPAAATRHIAVLGREATEMLAPRDGGIYVDATFGAGG